MMFANSNGERITARRGILANCPQCDARVIPKCGTINVHHWAHEARADCDPWWEHETRWHSYWKGLLSPDRVEVTIGNHRADIVRSDGTVIELQHSTISTAEISEREKFYGKMIWLFDGRGLFNEDYDCALDLRPRGNYTSFRWKHPRKHYGYCQKPVYIDLGKGCPIFRLHKLYLDEPPYGGWGRLGTHHRFVEWLRA
jgi:hypothetical protein